MIRLSTLGGLDLRGSEGPAIRAVLAQPKRFALLTYLAVANSHSFRRRDSVVALFWPELDQEHARNALRQALWFLRRSLGERAIIGRSEEELGVDPAVLRCDATEFEQACGAGRPEEALELYRGDFLEGFFVSEASPELERWVDEERTRLRQLAAETAWTLAEARANEEDRVAAGRWARRAAAFLPNDETSTRRLIVLLDRLGDRTGAVQVFEALARRLHEELDLAPDPETCALIDAVRSRASPPVTVGDRPHHSGAPTRHAQTLDVPQSVSTSRPRPRRAIGLAIVIAGLGLAGVGAFAGWLGTAPRVDPNVVAVMPFRISASDSALGYLRHGMVDLLAAELTGEGGPRAVDPRAVLHAYGQPAGLADQGLTREAAVGIAQRLGAAQLIEGGVLGTRDHLVLSASLFDVPGGRTVARARVEGPADSIGILVDGLTAQLLADEAGEREGRLADVASLAALRAYLSGKAAERDGRLWEAVRQFDRALQADSGFALAALGLATVSGQIAGTDLGRAFRLAWAGRERLSPGDRALLTAQVGPRYPALPTRAELLNAAEAAVEAAPDRPEAWYALGEAYFHGGALLGLDDPRPRAADLFRRGLVLDSARGTRRPFVEPLMHLMEISLANGDAAAARSWGAMLLADSSREGADFVRWRLALGTGDSATLRSLRARLDQMDEASLSGIMDAGQVLGVGVGDAERAGGLLEGHFGPEKQWGINLWTLRVLTLNLGRPSKTVWLTDRLPNPDRWLPHLQPLLKVLDRLFWSGDSAAAAEGARQLDAFAAAPVPSDLEGRTVRANDLCALALWWIDAGDVARAARALSRFESVSVADSSSSAAGNKAVCTAMLEASLAATQHLPTTPELTARLDSILLTGPPTDWMSEATIVAGRLQASVGNHAAALRAFRRFADNNGQTYYLSTFLREQGREATLVGDTADAVRAYRHYLALRSAPEPGLQPEAERVRAELSRLGASARGVHD
jgi:DNA-binding SARP family transcriptional activator/tetratricopeptide (TPR) repeat protein